mmetsp:Transcript_34060/g.55163  ORF Transcript_34060/g.55163 Transcript_34060/m.55163 type:complete len:577 (+) Transcript_34060:19-1749(+)
MCETAWNTLRDREVRGSRSLLLRPFPESIIRSVVPVHSSTTGAHTSVFNLSYNHSGNVLIGVCEDGGIVACDGWSGQRLNRVVGHDDCANVVRFLTDMVFVTGSDDSSIRVWDLRKFTESSCVNTLSGHTSWVKSVERVSADTIISCAFDATVREWDINKKYSRPCTSNVVYQHTSISRMRLSPDASILAVSFQSWGDGHVMLINNFDLATARNDLSGLDVTLEDLRWLSNRPYEECIDPSPVLNDRKGEESRSSRTEPVVLNSNSNSDPLPPFSTIPVNSNAHPTTSIAVDSNSNPLPQFLNSPDFSSGHSHSDPFGQPTATAEERHLNDPFYCPPFPTYVGGLPFLNDISSQSERRDATLGLVGRARLRRRTRALRPIMRQCASPRNRIELLIESGKGSTNSLHFDPTGQYLVSRRAGMRGDHFCSLFDVNPFKSPLATSSNTTTTTTTNNYNNATTCLPRGHGVDVAWNVFPERLLFKFKDSSSHQDYIKEPAFSGCSRYVLSPYYKGLRLFNFASALENRDSSSDTSTELSCWLPLLNTHCSGVLTCTWHPYLPRFASGGLDDSILLYGPQL